MNTDERTQVKQVKKLETLRQRFQRWRGPVRNLVSASSSS